MFEDQDLNPTGEIADGGEQGNEDLRTGDEGLDEAENGHHDGAQQSGSGVKRNDHGAGGVPPAGGTKQSDGGSDEAGRQQQDDVDRRFNSAMRATRLTTEKETRERVTKETDDKIAGMKIPNPYRKGTYFSTLAELEEYSKQLQLADAENRAKKEGRTVEDVIQEDEDRAFLRQIREERKAGDADRQKQAQQTAFIARDLADFQSRYPDVDVEKLDANKNFRKFAGTRYGKEPLAELYSDYVELVGDAGTAALAKAQGKSERSSGAGSGGEGGALTGAQRAQLNRWNEEHPEMRMTEKEFLEM